MQRDYGVTSSAHGQIRIPLHGPSGLQLGVLIRTISGTPKYYVEPEDGRSYLYNYHRRPVSKPIIIPIFESPFDVMTFPRYSVALVGTALSRIQLTCLEELRASLYVLAFDLDVPGHEASFRNASLLTKRGLTTVVTRSYLEVENSWAQLENLAATMRQGTLLFI